MGKKVLPDENGRTVISVTWGEDLKDEASRPVFLKKRYYSKK